MNALSAILLQRRTQMLQLYITTNMNETLILFLTDSNRLKDFESDFYAAISRYFFWIATNNAAAFLLNRITTACVHFVLLKLSLKRFQRVGHRIALN